MRLSLPDAPPPRTSGSRSSPRPAPAPSAARRCWRPRVIRPGTTPDFIFRPASACCTPAGSVRQCVRWAAPGSWSPPRPALEVACASRARAAADWLGVSAEMVPPGFEPDPTRGVRIKPDVYHVIFPSCIPPPQQKMWVGSYVELSFVSIVQ